MSENKTSELNIVELLMGIKEDVSSIKTDMANFKEAQKLERESTVKELEGLRADYKRDLSELESKIMSRINGIQSVQNNLAGDVDTLKHAETEKDAKKWRTVLAYVCTAIGSMLIAKLPDIVKMIYMISINNGGK